MSRRDDRLAVIALLFGACVIGVGPILVRLATTGPASAGFWRLAFALPLLVLLDRAEPKAAEAPALPRAALLAGLAFAGDLVFWHYGIHFTSVANATVLTNLTPIVVTALAWLVFKQRPRPVFLVALSLAVGGAAIMGLARNGGAVAGEGGRNPHLGDLLSLLATLWYTAYFLSVQSARRSAGAARVMLISTTVAAPLILATALFVGERVAPLTAAGWAACVGLGVMHVAGQGSIAWALGRLPAPLAAVVVLVQPVVAGLLGWLVFAEALSPLQGVGAAVALAGVALAQAGNASGRRPSGRRPPEAVADDAG